MQDSAAFAAQRVQRFPDGLTEALPLDLELHRQMHEDVAFWDMALDDAERAVLRDPTYLDNYALYAALKPGCRIQR